MPPKPKLLLLDNGAVIWAFRTHGTDGVAFLTADGPAIEASVALDVSETAMSLESVLRSRGLTKPLPERRCDSFVQRKLRDGGIRLAQGRARAP